MANFFEKLKKGMGIEEAIEEKIEEEKEKATRKASRSKKEKSNPSAFRQENIHIKTKLIKAKVERVEEPEKKEKLLSVPASIEETEKETMPLPSQIDEELQKEEDKEKWFEAEGQLAVDVYQTNQEFVIQTTIAGVKPEDLDITIEEDTVTIRGKRERPYEKEGRNYFYQECYWGAFSKQIILPEEVDSGRAEALMKEGVLTIRIPRILKQRKKKITIKTKE